jgi:branched-chain amino acid transport system ATP-binding protein
VTALLELADVCAWYGANQVLHGVNLCIGAGEIVALLGRKGAGRSTTAKAIMGLVERRGRLRFHGIDLSCLRPWQIARAGIGYVAETRDVFPALTVAQNLLLGARDRAKRARIDDCYDLFPPLAARADAPAGVLSGGEQQMLALARALVGAPRLLIVDEPAEGLSPQFVCTIAATLAQLRDRGVAILLIEQKLAIALDLARRVIVLGHGRTVFESTTEQLVADPERVSAWLTVPWIGARGM